MKDLVVITGYKNTCFTNDKNENIDCVKVSCFTKNNGDCVGYVPTQFTFKDLKKKEILNSLSCVPGIYEAEYALVPGTNNKAKLEIVGFNLLQEADISQFFDI